MHKRHKFHPLSILFVASEAAPFAKEGGLGDVVGALPKYLSKMGHDVKVVIPRYWCVDSEKYNLKKLDGVLVVPMGIIGKQYCGVYETVLPGSKVSVYLLEHENYYGRAGLYQQHGKGYQDNDNRFIFLSKGGLEICKMLNFTPDVIHIHDWHTAAIAPLLNSTYLHDRYVGNAATLLTIHNMQHQGNFYPGAMDVLGIGWKHFNYLELEKDDQVNLLKGGIYHSTILSTVSRGYAREIQTSDYGWGLEGVIRDRAADLYGILNGVDYDEWNPSKDRFIAANYSASKMNGKSLCKKDLQQHFGLPVREDIPVFGVVSRMVKQKGTDILAEAIHKILSLDIQFVMIGNGEPWAHFYFGDIAAKYPEKFRCFIGYDEALAHKVEAGADFFVMPSAFEPCGLNQMYSLAYGTPPIVRATGGLDDSIENFDEHLKTGDGFKFYQHSANALFDTIGWGTYIYYNDKKGLKALRANGMKKRFTWEEAALSYNELYMKGLLHRRGWEYFRNRFGEE